MQLIANFKPNRCFKIEEIPIDSGEKEYRETIIKKEVYRASIAFILDSFPMVSRKNEQSLARIAEFFNFIRRIDLSPFIENNCTNII